MRPQLIFNDPNSKMIMMIDEKCNHADVQQNIHWQPTTGIRSMLSVHRTYIIIVVVVIREEPIVRKRLTSQRSVFSPRDTNLTFEETDDRPSPSPVVIMPYLTSPDALPISHLLLMLLLSRSHKVCTTSGRIPKKGNQLTWAKLDGTVNVTASVGGPRQLGSINSTAMTVSPDPRPNSNAAQEHQIGEGGATQPIRSIQLDLTIVRTIEADGLQHQYSWADAFPISESRDSVRYLPSHTKQHVGSAFPKLQSRQETNVVAVTLTSPSSSTQCAVDSALSIRTDRTQQKRRRRRYGVVRFDSIHIREHSVTIGDHDWCDGTLAITLDWPHTETTLSIAVDDYEAIRDRTGRSPAGRPRKLSHWERKQLLHRIGGIPYDDLDLFESTERTCKAQTEKLKRSTTSHVLLDHHHQNGY
jgi:hypothetical protein